jgi:hypothetical protein
MYSQSVFNLFKSLPISSIKCSDEVYESWIKSLIPLGVLVASDGYDPDVNFNKLTPQQLNSTFHKSWDKVANATDQQLYTEQILHYFSTYGLESIGLSAIDWRPDDMLDIPEFTKDLVVIPVISKDEIKTKLMTLLKSGIALHSDTINDIIEVCSHLNITDEDLAQIKNKEVMIRLYVNLDIIPNDPVEFLRYIIYIITGTTLIIKSKTLINQINTCIQFHEPIIATLIDNYHEITKLASIFNRYKPIWLAMRYGRLKPRINRISKLSKIHHIPTKSSYVNNITSLLKHGKYPDDFELEVSKLSYQHKVKLAKALMYRTKHCESIVYKVRNGRSYATNFEFNEHELAGKCLRVVLRSIADGLNVRDLKIYIPDYIEYTLPTSEKDFTGNIPNGSYLSVDNNLVFGVHWESMPTDLDLSLVSSTRKIGWNSQLRNDNILFSGDITRGPATEAYHVSNINEGSDDYSVNLNYFNYNFNEIDYTLIFAKSDSKSLQKNYTFDPNEIITQIPMKISSKQVNLGMVCVTPNNIKYIFNDSTTGNRNISSHDSDISKHINIAQRHQLKSNISLRSLLQSAGANLVGDLDDNTIDLSPDVIDRTTLIDVLFNGN